MNSKKIQNRLEKLINSLTINENQKIFLRRKANDFYKELKENSQYQMPYSSSIYLSTDSYQYMLMRFWYEGSFDRGLFIKNRFDIDNYFVFSKEKSSNVNLLNNNRWENNSNEKSNLTGDLLFELLYSHLKTYQYYYETTMKILKDPPYEHAIPIRMDYQGISILFDCIPAIEQPDGCFIIPNGLGGIKKINRNLEEQALSKLNKMQNEKITKLILLMKYWNFTWGKPLKGYLIERLVECIFDKVEINNWDKAVKTFFNQATYILNNKKRLADRVYGQYSILDEYSKDQLKSFLEIFIEGANYAQKEYWNEIFNEF